MITYTGTGKIASTDYHTVKWVGETKAGKAVTIELENAINLEGINWGLANEDDVVPATTFEATYDNTDEIPSDTAEPWKLTIDDTAVSGAASILLGTGVFYIDGTSTGLNRGGGSFTVDRTYREITADGDRGAVKDRILMTQSRAKLAMNNLSFLGHVEDLYPAINKA